MSCVRKKNVVPDTFSRRSDSSQQQDDVSNVGPAYSNNMGPPDWVSSPVIAANSSANMHMDTEGFVMGVTLSQLASFNHPPETLLASMEVPLLQAITWDMLESACNSCKEYQLLHQTILRGISDDRNDWDSLLLPYYRLRHLLTTIGPIILVNDRPLIPKSLCARVIDHLHAGHPGPSTMCQCLSSSLYWPNYREDLTTAKLCCATCTRIAPSNPSMPPRPVEEGRLRS